MTLPPGAARQKICVVIEIEIENLTVFTLFLTTLQDTPLKQHLRSVPYEAEIHITLFRDSVHLKLRPFALSEL